eukprot:CAMPEP_0201592056 /NCGR_PEP_ID=MMETSP0190_2-20130828/190052_1 /ASSEMBLY_ACC=CAM_ASM_000263 /TAXON_ID=37353 /ORGANISM="Rosalina sp." /LENGTH=701 /DNA_ID=CAMNT_0048050647 /DNA_START=504 /DNA_END=2609 /DNA_ORIENTATION=-
MKKILASLLTAYVLTNGQAPPVDLATNTVSTGTTISPQTNTAAPPANPPGTTLSSPAVVTPAPVTPVPVQVTPAPVTAAPVILTPAPVTPAPVTAAPVIITPAPVTPAPVTPAPVTPAPVTPAPVTPSPTYNPWCPLDAGQQSGLDPQALQFNENAVCFSPQEVATDYLGRLRCNNFACCQCGQINCGFNGYPCEQLSIGDSGAVGVQSINIRGAPEMNGNPLQGIFGGTYGSGNGAKMQCTGKESCLGTIIRGEAISDAECSGDMGCQSAKIIINDPMPLMNMQCNGLATCELADIQINIGVAEAASRAPGQACNPAFAGIVFELGKIEFNGLQSGKSAKVSINNQGCGTALFDGFECMSPEACPGIMVNVEGNVAIKNCDLQGIAPGNPIYASLLNACQAGQMYQNWSPNQGPQVPPQGPPQPGFGLPPQGVPPQGVPPNPVNPNPSVPSPPFNPNPQFPPQGQQPPFMPPQGVPPNPVNPNPALPPPFNPNPAVPSPGMPVPVMPGFGVRDPRSAKLVCQEVAAFPGMGGPGFCAGTTQTIQIANNFIAECSVAGACNGMTLTLNAGYDPIRNPVVATTYIDSFKFIQAQSDVTIYINNEFGAMGQPVRINDIRCENPGACRNLKIIAGPGVDILSTNYDCGSISACMGATVTQGSTTFPMDPRTMAVPGFGQPAFGAPPTFPGQPQPPQQFNPFTPI